MVGLSRTRFLIPRLPVIAIQNYANHATGEDVVVEDVPRLGDHYANVKSTRLPFRDVLHWRHTREIHSVGHRARGGNVPKIVPPDAIHFKKKKSEIRRPFADWSSMPACPRRVAIELKRMEKRAKLERSLFLDRAKAQFEEALPTRLKYDLRQRNRRSVLRVNTWKHFLDSG